jgi:DNA helicase IV
MLQAMWEKQWPSDEYELFTTNMVIELCDRKDIYWDITFEDLMSLKRQRKVEIVELFTEKKLFPPCWGLKQCED